MTSVCLLTLCGLPAAGKTTFVTSFMDYLKHMDTPPAEESGFAVNQKCGGSLPYRLIHINYDELIPCEVEMSLMSDSEQCAVSQWKLYRKVILRCLDSFLRRFCDQTADELSEMSTDAIYNNISPFFLKLYDGLSSNKRHGAVILVIDDNMYYSSMRYQLYQLARKYSTGFAQIYFPVDVKEALERNSHRNFPVANDVIVSMSSKIDVPTPDNSWEALTTEWQPVDCSQRNFDKVLALIEQALHRPVSSASDSLESERQESRTFCSKSIHHQSDCILRRLLTDFVAALRTDVTDSAEVSRRAKCANTVRQRILDELRQQTLVIPQSAIDCLRQNDTAPINSDHPLYVFIKEIFTERLSEAA